VTDADPYETIARFYDLAADGFGDDLDFYEALARRVDAPVLDLGTGTGRVALALAARGLEAVGIDRSKAMLAIACEKAERAGVRVKLLHDDMRRPRLSGRFGLIVCALDTFLHLGDTAEQIAMLDAARKLLAPGGLIALDLPGPGGDWGDWDAGARPLVLDWSVETADGRVTRLTSFQSDLSTQTRTVFDVFEESDRSGAVRRHTVSYRLRFVFPAELELLFRLAALRMHARYGDYDLGPFTAESPRMLVLVAAGTAPAAC
jgi:SAM-dependent methyltransferase